MSLALRVGCICWKQAIQNREPFEEHGLILFHETKSTTNTPECLILVKKYSIKIYENNAETTRYLIVFGSTHSHKLNCNINLTSKTCTPAEVLL